MKKIALFGAGGFGREMVLMIEQINHVSPTWELIGFFDDGIPKGHPVDGHVVLGDRQTLNDWREDLAVCVAIADPEIRHNIVDDLHNPQLTFPCLFHPQCLKGSAQNSFGDGCIITAGVILTTAVTLGKFCIVNLASTLGHDVRMGDFCTVMPGCSISGNVHIGSRTVLGAGSRIIQGIAIGEDGRVGAGAVVTKSFGNKKRILGVPARSI